MRSYGLGLALASWRHFRSRDECAVKRKRVHDKSQPGALRARPTARSSIDLRLSKEHETLCDHESERCDKYARRVPSRMFEMAIMLVSTNRGNSIAAPPNRRRPKFPSGRRLEHRPARRRAEQGAHQQVHEESEAHGSNQSGELRLLHRVARLMCGYGDAPRSTPSCESSSSELEL
jgi:hypothetical protein